jgi:dethiobiotin synthetase
LVDRVPPKSFFITGSDTGVGKTLVATGLLLAAARRGLRTVGIKPVSAGCERRGGEQLFNDDALALQAAATVTLDYRSVNPVALEPFLAPHIAAAQAGVELTSGELVEHLASLQGIEADLMIVEGAGGWLVPLNESETMADVCRGLNMPAIMVVGMRLGCLNHALLTAVAMREAGVHLAGWIANSAEPEMVALEENLQTLRARLSAPLLGTIPFKGAGCTAEDIIDYLDIKFLMDSREVP